jgi:hypothetical protein
MSISKLLCMLLSMNPGYDTEVCRTGDPMNACWI